MRPLEITNSISSQNNEIKLSSEQEKNFSNYLKAKEAEQQRQLTSEEITKLREEFLKNQNKSSEILSWTKLEENFWSKENFEKFMWTIDNSVYNYFFKNPWILKDKNIPENQKFNFVSWASIFFLNNLYNSFEENWFIKDFEKNFSDFTKDDSSKLDKIINFWKMNFSLESDEFKKNLWNFWNLISDKVGDFLKNIFSEEKVYLLSEVLNDWSIEKSNIFKNPNISFEFLEKIFIKNENKENILKFIFSENSSLYNNELKKYWENFSKIISRPEIWKILISSLETQKMASEKNFSKIFEDKEILGFLTFLTNIPIIWEFIKWFLGEFWINLDNLWSNNEKTFEIIKNKISEKWSFLEETKIPENFWRNSNWKIDWTFLDNLKIISKNKAENEYEKDLEKLFKKWWEFENFIKNEKLKEIPNFWEKNILKNEKGEIIFENLKYLVSLYKEFLENGKNLEDFIKGKIENKKNIQDEIYAWQTQKGATIQNFQNPSKEQKLEEAKTEKIQIITQKLNEAYLVKLDEWINILWNKISLVFDLNWEKFEANSYNTWDFTLTWKWKRIIFSGNKELFTFLSWFNWKLDNKAKWSDFGETWIRWNVELNWKTIREILINGLNEQVWFMWFSEHVNKPWLKQLISTNFFTSWEVKKENVSIDFWDKSFNFNFKQELS